MTNEESHFLALVKEGEASAVPRSDGSATVWAGGKIRTLWHERRERIGNALLKSGRLRFGQPIAGSNSVQIEIAE